MRILTAVIILLLPLTVFWTFEPPVADSILPLYVTRGIYVTDLLLFPLLLAAVLTNRLRWPGNHPLLIPLVALPALAVLTSGAAIVPGFAVYSAARWLLAGLLAIWLAGSNMPTRQLVLIFLLSAGLQALVGLGQVVTQAPLGLPGELALPPKVRGAAIVDVASGRWLRAYGLTFHPNILGGYMAAGIVLGLTLLRDRRVWPLWWLLWLGLFISFSRSAWIATAVILPVCAALLRWRRPELQRPLAGAAAGAAVVLLVGALLWPQQLAVRLAPLLPAGLLTAPPAVAPLETFSLDERAHFNAVARDIIASRPWAGVGAGGFPIALVARDDPVRPQFVHNVTLLLGAEVGLLGSALWLALGAAGLFTLFTAFRSRRWPALTAAGAWLALFIISFFDSYPWALHTGHLLTGFVIGLACRKQLTENRERKTGN